MLQHTEDWSVDELTTLPIDGFEMYNLHANTIMGAGAAIGLIADLKTPEELPYPDLVFLPIFNEDKRYLERWGKRAGERRQARHDDGHGLPSEHLRRSLARR